MLSGRVIQANVPPPQNGNIGYDEDMGYRTMTREDAAMIQQISTPGTVHTPISQQPPNSQNIPQSPPNAQGHHRTSRQVCNHLIIIFANVENNMTIFIRNFLL